MTGYTHAFPLERLPKSLNSVESFFAPFFLTFDPSPSSATAASDHQDLPREGVKSVRKSE